MNAVRFSGWWKNRETVKTELKNSWWGEDDGGGGMGVVVTAPWKYHSEDLTQAFLLLFRIMTKSPPLVQKPPYKYNNLPVGATLNNALTWQQLQSLGRIFSNTHFQREMHF